MMRGRWSSSVVNTKPNLLGTITNNGNIQVNGGAATNTLLNISGNVTLQGPGTVTLSTATGSGAAFIQQSGGNFFLPTPHPPFSPGLTHNPKDPPSPPTP